MSVVFAALMVLALLPIPIFILAFVLPLSRAATNALIVVFTVITVISLYRLFRGLGSA